MIEVRFHGRGGQGSVTAAELMAQAAISEGKYAQAFPSFGPERRGAPVTAFLRISTSQIFLREKIDFPDVVVILDPRLLELVDVFHGLKKGGTIIVNCSAEYRKTLAEKEKYYRVVTVDATRIALETIGLPIANTAIIGALVKSLGIIDIHSLENPLYTRFGKLAEKNINALTKAYESAHVANSVLDYEFENLDKRSSFSEVIKNEALMGWREFEIGGDIVKPSSSRDFLTGSWRMSGRPILHQEQCNKCGLCWIFCPEDAFDKDTDGFLICDLNYCKGCGICAQECPKGAIEMEEEA
ncbi:MAG: 2-oxoacid:acceptor oxidoreductase family protein [Desulfovermiculus sp.]|nr:2-oxoacid:acceptor oxidoreductase family protein [Desulfovermiculus sp.]